MSIQILAIVYSGTLLPIIKLYKLFRYPGWKSVVWHTTWVLSLFVTLSFIFFCCCCSAAHSRPTLCNSVDYSTLGFPVHHEACSNSWPLSQWCHPTISSSVTRSPALNLSQHQGLLHWISSSHQVAKVLEFQLHYQSFQWIFRTDWNRLVWSPCSPRDSQESYKTTVQKHQFFSAQPS